MHPERVVIDWRLSRPVVDVSALGVEFGLTRYALRAHRDAHAARAITRVEPRPGQHLNALQEAVQRRYWDALDALAYAERAALLSVDGHDRASGAVSMTSVAAKIRAARRALDSLAITAWDASTPEGQQQQLLAARIGNALANIHGASPSESEQ
jgi:hypothetical protein